MLTKEQKRQRDAAYKRKHRLSLAPLAVREVSTRMSLLDEYFRTLGTEYSRQCLTKAIAAPVGGLDDGEGEE